MQNFIKTILNGVQAWVKGKINASTADWNQNDYNADNYVKNRTHWEEERRVTLVNNLTFSDYDSGNAPQCNFVPGQKYDVIWNGVLYKALICHYEDEWRVIASNNNGCPFYIDDDGGDDLYISPYDDDNNWVVSIIEDNTVIHKLDSKYLDLPTNLATTNDVQEAVDVANAAQSTADTAVTNAATAQSTADSKMNAINPVGAGGFSMNRRSNHVAGIDSVAVGTYNIANEYSSFAEGFYTSAGTIKASLPNSFTEKNNGYSHAEGMGTWASGQASHAEGRETTASGQASHAEGYSTTASGQASHAEGCNTIASGNYSHAEGYSTTATRRSQHTQGECNILDTVGSATIRGKYAHIVGNGTSVTKRSNAHTLDWNGVGWFQGGLQVGGNAQDDGAKNVLLEGDAVPVPETAQVGQTIAVKAVDENGKPVEWEATNFSASGGSGCIASDIAPEDTSVLWIDTADNSDDTLQDAVNIALAQAKESGEFKGDPGKTPEKGVDYYTDTDKAELVNAVLSALPAWTGGSY